MMQVIQGLLAAGKGKGRDANRAILTAICLWLGYKLEAIDKRTLSTDTRIAAIEQRVGIHTARVAPTNQLSASNL